VGGSTVTLLTLQLLLLLRQRAERDANEHKQHACNARGWPFQAVTQQVVKDRVRREARTYREPRGWGSEPQVSI
jgi:hypothetical protein